MGQWGPAILDRFTPVERTWVAEEGSYVAFASAGIAFLSSAVIFIPMARRGALHGRSLLVGGVFYAAYLLLVIGVVMGAFG